MKADDHKKKGYEAETNQRGKDARGTRERQRACGEILRTMNHLRQATLRSSSVVASAIAEKSSGRSHQ